MPASQLTRARKLLSDAQISAFLRAAAKEDHPRAPAYMCRDLAKGRSLDEIFKESRTGIMWAELEVKQVSARTFKITVGYRGEVGDGGEWLVVYTASGKVQRIEPQGFWMH